jgi:hypothetical protein
MIYKTHLLRRLQPRFVAALAALLFVPLSAGCVGGKLSHYELAKFAAEARNDAKTAASEARGMLDQSERELVAYKSAALDAKLLRLTEGTSQAQGGVIYADQARTLAKLYAADVAALTAARARRAEQIGQITRKISLAGDNIDAIMRAEEQRAVTAVELQDFAQSALVSTLADLSEFQATQTVQAAAIEAAQAAENANAESAASHEEPPATSETVEPTARR